MREYVFNVGGLESFEDWWDLYLSVVAGVDVGFFGRNRGAYRDSLVGGPGCPELPCRFVFEGAKSLDHGNLVDMTIAELERVLTRCHPTGKGSILSEIELLRHGRGSTILDWILRPAIEAEGIEVVVTTSGA